MNLSFQELRPPFLPKTLLLLLILILNGCGGKLQSLTVTSPPDVVIGPEIELLGTEVEKVAVAMDSVSRAHILALAVDNREIYYLLAEDDTFIMKEPIPRALSSAPKHFDIALDKHALPHVILGDEHIMRDKDGQWQTLPKDSCQFFIRGGPDLICGYWAKGKDIGAPWNFNLIGIGGYGGAIIFPWISHPDKLAVVWKDSDVWSIPTFLDLDSSAEQWWPFYMADSSGTVQIVYSRGKRGGLLDNNTLAYARLEKPLNGDRPNLSIDTNDKDVAAQQATLPSVTGKQIAWHSRIPHSANIAVDPVSGNALIVKRSGGSDWLLKWQSIMVENGELGPPLLFIEGPGSIYLAAAGDNGFHAIAKIWPRGTFSSLWPIFYLDYKNSQWSDFIELAEIENEEALTKIVSNGTNRAYALYPRKDDRLYMRRIDQKK